MIDLNDIKIMLRNMSYDDVSAILFAYMTGLYYYEMDEGGDLCEFFNFEDLEKNKPLLLRWQEFINMRLD